MAAIANAAGTVFLKKSRLAADVGFVSVLISPWFLSALLIYSVGLLFFAQALGQLPVSASQPVMAGVSFVSAALLASVIFGEQLTFNQLVAISLIVAGIAVMTRS